MKTYSFRLAGLLSVLCLCGHTSIFAQGLRVIEGQDKVEIVGDISYAENDNPRQTLDLLLPKVRQDEHRLPVLAYIHGGGWRAGNKRGGRWHLMKYVAGGKFAGVTIGYRLSGEAIWPAQIHDCKAGIRWIRANADLYGLDPDRILVWGHSAGGHLSSMLGTSGDVEELEGTIGRHLEMSSRVQAVANFYGPSDFLQMDAYRLPEGLIHEAAESPESMLIGGPIQEHPEKVAMANPIIFVSKDDPVFLSIHGTQDRLVPAHQSVILHEALQKAGVLTEIYLVKGGGHGRFQDPEVIKRQDAFFERFRNQ